MKVSEANRIRIFLLMVLVVTVSIVVNGIAEAVFSNDDEPTPQIKARVEIHLQGAPFEAAVEAVGEEILAEADGSA